jgi:uncharacterized protein
MGFERSDPEQERAMTPQERQLVSELFDRLAKLEDHPRDPDAERTIADGFDRAPNAAYALVQTVLVQDEALKRANARIEELEAALGHDVQHAEEGGGFLDTMRNTMFGREPQRGSVPSVRSGAGMGRSGVWNTGARPVSGGQAASEPQYAPPPQALGPAFGGGGGSFLGTAAAGAAGVIGGAMLLNGIRSMFGPSHSPGSSAAFDPGLSGGGSPLGGRDASGSDMARDAGLNDIGSNRSAAFDDNARRTGLLDSDDDTGQDDDVDDDSDYAGDVGGDDSDTA